MIAAGLMGLAVAFVLLASIWAWILIRATKYRALKFVMIPILIWYSLVVYFAPSNLIGWPCKTEPPDGAIILAFQISEPTYIYIWAVDGAYDPIPTLDPRGLTKYTFTGTPRAHTVLYTKSLHKELIAAEKQKRERNHLLFWRRYTKSRAENTKDGITSESWRPEDKEDARGHRGRVEARDPKEFLQKELPTEPIPQKTPLEAL